MSLSYKLNTALAAGLASTGAFADLSSKLLGGLSAGPFKAHDVGFWERWKTRTTYNFTFGGPL